jgi:hypothetical protein
LCSGISFGFLDIWSWGW